MVLMHRKDIIEQYGFDPAEDSSVVPKGEVTAPINVVPDEEKIKEPSDETPTAANPLSNLAAGFMRNLTSEPMQLYGTASALAYWANQRLKGNEDASFMEGKYEKGGIEKVRDHLNQYTAKLQEEHPDWSPTAITDEVTRYQATPEFFEFNTGQMIPALRHGLRLAYDINKATGVGKTPEQETMLDQVTQMLGGLLVPTGWLKLADTGGKIAGKLGRIAGHALDFTVVPGVAGAPTAGKIAGNLAVGTGILEAQRQLTDQPALLPLGGPSALAENFKEQGRVSLEPSGTTPPELPVAAPVIPEGVDPSLLKPQESSFGLAATLLGLAGGAALGARGAFRGRAPHAVAPAVRDSISADIAANRAAAGVGLPEDPNLLHRVIERADEKLDINAPITQQARELGVEEPVQAELGQYLTSHGQQLALKNVWEDGVTIDNTKVTPVKQHFDVFAAADPVSQKLHDDAIQADNILKTIEKSRLQATAEENIALRKLQANPTDPDLQAAAAKAQQTNLLWQQYHPEIRRYLPDTPEAELQNRVQAGMSDPQARALIDNFADINRTKDRMLYEGGIIDLKEMRRRAQEDPYHTGLFEYDPKGKQKYDPTQERTTELRPTVRVHDPLPPMASQRLSLEIASRAAANETGKRNAIRTLQAADPKGEFVRVYRPEEKTNSQFGRVVEFYEDGQQYKAQFARDHVADAVAQSPIDGGMLWNFFNSIKLAAQVGYIGLIKGPLQAPITFGYNAITAWATQHPGTSIGYTSRLIRNRAPNNVVVNKIADAVDSLFVHERVAAYGATLLHSTALKASYALGQKMMTQSITRGGLFGMLANAIPNGHQIMANIGGRMKAYHDASWLMYWNRWGESGAHPALFDKDIFVNRYMRDIRQYAQGTPHGALYQWGGFKPVFKAELAVLNHIAALHQMTHVAREAAGMKQLLGRNPTLSEMRIPVEQARISAGDMAARSGGKVIRGISAAVPFFRIAVASARYIFQAMTTRGPWDSGMVAVRIAGVAAAMYESQKTIEQLGLTDWFYEQLNDFERLGRYWMLKPKHRIDMLLGKKPQLDLDDPKNNFYEPPIPQELGAYFGTILYGFEQLGQLNRGSNRGNTSAEKDYIYNVMQTLGISSSPAINAITMPFGYKVDPAQLFKGRNPISQMYDSKGQLGELPSGIPSRVAETLKALFGFNADIVTNSLDAGIQDYKKTDSALHATWRAWDEFSGMWKDSAPSFPGLWDAEKKHYQFDAMSTESGRIKKVAESLETAYQNTFTAGGEDRGEHRKKVLDPEVADMLDDTHYYFQRSGMPKIQKDISLILNQIDDLKASKGELTYNEVKTKTFDLIKQLKPYYTEQADLIKEYESELRDKYGARFKKEGLEPSVDSVAKLVGKYSG